MEPIAWTEEFTVGVVALDAQHRRIVGMINRLAREPAAPTGDATVSDVLTAMTRYAEEHFRFEERLLEEHGYPGLTQQREEHRAFRMKTADLCNAAMDGTNAAPDVLLAYLRDWWTRHILEEDMRYKPFFAARGVK